MEIRRGTPIEQADVVATEVKASIHALTDSGYCVVHVDPEGSVMLAVQSGAGRYLLALIYARGASFVAVWARVLLVLLAIGRFAAEVKVASYGLLTLGGLVAMILGAMMLVDSPLPELRVDVWKLVPFIVAFAAFTIALVRLVIQAQRRRPQTGAEGLVGRRGEAETALDPEGWVVVQGKRWRARSAERVAPGDPVVVESVEGLLLRVRKGA